MILKILCKCICVGHKIIVKRVVYVAMDPLEFLMMSHLFPNDGDGCSVIFFVIYYDLCEHLRLSKTKNSL